VAVTKRATSTDRPKQAAGTDAWDVTTEWLDAYLRGNGLDPLPGGVDGAWEAAFVSQLIRRTHDHFRAIRATGENPGTRLGDPEQLAARVVAAAPLEPSPLEELTGPFYDTAGLRHWLDVTRQALLDRVKAHTLLGMQTGGRTWVYPAWQFLSTGNGQTIPHLTEVLRALAAGIDDPWTWALWLQAPDEDLEGMTSVAWLDAGRDPAPVLRDAHADAARWAA
jgi:hypothetical protein